MQFILFLCKKSFQLMAEAKKKKKVLHFSHVVLDFLCFLFITTVT